jgi:hypothetical protein
MPQAIPRPTDLPPAQHRRSGDQPNSQFHLTNIGDSTAGSSTCVAPHSGSATSPTTSPDRYSRPAGSDPNYTLDREEPAYTPPLRLLSFASRRVRGVPHGPVTAGRVVQVSVGHRALARRPVLFAAARCWAHSAWVRGRVAQALFRHR